MNPKTVVKAACAVSLLAFTMGAAEPKADAPSAAEWKDAAVVQLARPKKACEAFRVREWLRIRCKTVEDVPGMQLLGGSREGVTLAHDRADGAYVLTFPMRRGDRRVFQILRIAEWGKYTLDYDAGFAIFETWLPGEAEPTVVID